MNIKLGRGNYKIAKSKKLIGLKQFRTRGLGVANKSQTKQLHEKLGGFEILRVDEEVEDADKKLDEIRADEDVEIGTHIYHFEGNDKPLVPTGEILIIFNHNVDEEEQLLVLDEFHLDVIERRGSDRIIAKVTANSPNPLKTSKLLEDSSLVRIAEPDLDTFVDHYDFVTPKDRLFGHQWHLENRGFIPGENYPLKAGADAKVVNAWKRLGNFGSSDITIAIVDNGFDLKHPDINANIVAPFDFWLNSANLSSDGFGFTHGTPCAGVALGRKNSTGVVGAAPNSKFMPVSGTSFGWRATENIFNYCIDKGADVISCSWGSVDARFALNSVKEAAIRKAATEGRKGLGCVILFAAGNEELDYVNYYSAHPDVISVGASTSKDEHAYYSNKGREVTVVAPSNGDWPIIAPKASWDKGHWFDGIKRSNQHKHFGGTSSSTPLVAGICALILSANPKLTAKQVKEILIKTADKIGRASDYDSRGHSVKYGYGRVNADKAVAEAMRMSDNTGGNKPVVKDKVATGKGLFKFSVERQPSRGYGVQVGVYAQYGNVLIRAEYLEKKFQKPVVVNINEINGKTIYRVCLGTFATKNEATFFQKQMKNAGINGFVRSYATLK